MGKNAEDNKNTIDNEVISEIEMKTCEDGAQT